jgi:hypothetical protein
MLWITTLLIFIIIAVIFYILAGFSGAPWVPTSNSIVRKMLSMADIKPGEVLYDLGSGDGRIILMAAREFHATSVGIEINPFLILWTRLKITLSRLRSKVGVVWGNFFNQDLSKANIVTLYLLQDTNQKLKPKLTKELKPGTRVISHVFTFDGWNLQKVDEESNIYMYKIP